MRYQGGKYFQKKYIVPELIKTLRDNNLTTYIEPFVGGGNILAEIPERYDRYGYDINKYLIALYKYLCTDEPMPENITKEEFLDIKANPNNYPDWKVACAGILCTYGAKWMDSYGNPRNSNSSRKNSYQESLSQINKQRPFFKTTYWDCKDYKDIVLPNDPALIYCDAPYIDTTKYNYIRSFDFNEYYDWLKEISQKHFVVISEMKMPDDFIPFLDCQKINQLQNTSESKMAKNVKIEHLYYYKDGLMGDYKNENK